MTELDKLLAEQEGLKPEDPLEEAAIAFNKADRSKGLVTLGDKLEAAIKAYGASPREEKLAEICKEFRNDILHVINDPYTNGYARTRLLNSLKEAESIAKGE